MTIRMIRRRCAVALLAGLIAAAVLVPLLPGTCADDGIERGWLPNGLKVIMKEVHTAPVVAFQVWYEVGSRNEHDGVTGGSHLLEHMLFKGTPTLPKGEIPRLLDRVGARSNAFTSYDYTCYWETLASEHLELAMRIESDRMVNSLIDDAERQAEMSVVRSELEGRENNPRQVLGIQLQAAAYQSHAYHRPIIGWRSDVEGMSTETLRQYYRTYYMPNNAVVVMVGDFDATHAMELIRKYFGPLPPGEPPPRVITTEPRQRGERRVRVRMEGTTWYIQMAYHGPRLIDDDTYAMDVLDAVLSSGRASRLYQGLVETQLAMSAGSASWTPRDPGLFELYATVRQGVDVEKVEQALLEQVERARTTLPTPEELERVKNQVEAAYTFEKDSVTAQANSLGGHQILHSYEYVSTYVDRIRRVTGEDVQRVAREYFTEDNCTVGIFEPIAPAGARAPPPPGGGGPAPRWRFHDALWSGPRAEPVLPLPHTCGAACQPADRSTACQAEPLWRPHQPAYYRASRSVQSPAYVPALVSPPSALVTRTPPRRAAPTRTVLPNGMVVIVQENHANTTIAVAGHLHTGGVFDPPGKPGLAGFTSALLSRGTKRRTSLQLAQSTESVGASVSIGGGRPATTNFGGSCLTKHFDVVLDVLSDELRNPSFPEDEVEKLRNQALAGLQQSLESTRARAGRAFLRSVFPEGHPYAVPSFDEAIEAVKARTRQDAVDFYEKHYGPDTAAIVIVGDVDTEQAVAKVKQYFGDWEPTGRTREVRIPDAPLQREIVREVIPMMDKSQVDIILGHWGGVKRLDPDFYAVTVMNFVLGGGSTTSRLGEKVRDEMGLAYGIWCYSRTYRGRADWRTELGVNPQHVDKAVGAALDVIKKYKADGPTQAEVDDALAYITGSYPVALETNQAVAGQLLLAEYYDLGLDFIDRHNELYRQVTLEQVREAAHKHLHPEAYTLVIAGPYEDKG
ncbi:MAG: pitrilysin family protein [Armatimonadota bacterium]|jgi:zinc protease